MRLILRLVSLWKSYRISTGGTSTTTDAHQQKLSTNSLSQGNMTTTNKSFQGKLFGLRCSDCKKDQAHQGTDLTIVHNAQLGITQVVFKCSNPECYNQLPNSDERSPKLCAYQITPETSHDIIRFGGRLINIGWLSTSGRNEQELITENYIEWFTEDLEGTNYPTEVLEKEDS